LISRRTRGLSSMTVVLGAFAIRSLQLRYPADVAGPASFQ
jgi:hypothetical protein